MHLNPNVTPVWRKITVFSGSLGSNRKNRKTLRSSGCTLIIRNAFSMSAVNAIGNDRKRSKVYHFSYIKLPLRLFFFHAVISISTSSDMPVKRSSALVGRLLPISLLATSTLQEKRQHPKYENWNVNIYSIYSITQWSVFNVYINLHM